MKTILVIFGTRPEAIKMAPVVHALSGSLQLKVVTCATAQHRQMLDQVLEHFGITPDLDLNLMKENQTLFGLTADCLRALEKVYAEVKPDAVLVQGDTTTTFAAALAAFYKQIPIGHVEAGLRTGDKFAPFPEEINRRLVTPMADYHFAPTSLSVENLRHERVDGTSIFLTGNTSIDALLWSADQNLHFPKLEKLYEDRKLILMTAHRRENFGVPLKNIFAAVRQFAQENPDMHVVYPVHPNPNVKGIAHDALAGLSNVSLIAPVNYSELVFLMKAAHLVLTDSGGLQEEAPTMGKPVLVLRETTERPEAVTAGCAELVGHDGEKILTSLRALKEKTSSKYTTMANAKNPFGDGTAALQIRKILETAL